MRSPTTPFILHIQGVWSEVLRDLTGAPYNMRPLLKCLSKLAYLTAMCDYNDNYWPTPSANLIWLL